MNKKRLTFLALLMTAIIVLSLGMLVACNDEDPVTDTPTNNITATENLLISNGDFKVTGTASKAYPNTITSWTGGKMYSSGNYADDVIAGAINLTTESYNEYKSKWNDGDSTIYNALVANGRFGDSDPIKNALMIYMPKKDTDLGDDDATYGPTAYGYTSSSFSLEKGSYYKLTVDVLTYDIAGDGKDTNDPGARIYLSSNTYAEFSGIDTKGEWKTYEIFIESNPIAATSLSVMLGLGKYASTYSYGLTTGYAFFDNLSLDKIETAQDGTMPETVYQSAKKQELADNSRICTTTLKVPNGRFDFGTTTKSSSAAPSNWSVVTGNSSKDDPAPTSLGSNAVIDLSKFADNYKNYGGGSTLVRRTNSEKAVFNPATSLSNIVTTIQNQGNVVGNNVYMLSQQLMTAQGIKSSKQITIERNKAYALSIDLYTYDIHGAGVSLILSGSDGKDIVIKGISQNVNNKSYLGGVEFIDAAAGLSDSNGGTGETTGSWKTYTFYIQGNQFKNFNFNMNIWLGTEGKNKNTAVNYTKYTSATSSGSIATTYLDNGTFSTGWAFMDEVQLNEVEESVINNKKTDGTAYFNKDGKDFTLDCATSTFENIVVDLSSENLFVGNGNDLNSAQAGVTTTGNTSTQHGTPSGWTSNFDTTKDSNPVIDGGVITEGLVQIDSEQNFISSGGKGAYPNMPYNIVTQNAFMMHSSTESYYEVSSAPFIIEGNKFYSISLWVKTVDVKSTSGIYVYLMSDEGTADYDDDTTLSSFTKINTADYDEYTNDWCELTFVIRGATDKDTNVYFKYTLGTGNRFASSTLTSGAVYIANMNMDTITYQGFSDVKTNTYVKSVNMSTSYTSSFTNGGFNNYDFDAENLNESNADLATQSNTGSPENWTLDTTKQNNVADLVSGIIKLAPETKNGYEDLYFNHSAQTTALYGSNKDAFFDTLYGNEDSADYLSASNLVSIGGPSMLTVGSHTSSAYSAGYASDSFTLSANTSYKLSVWVKTSANTKASVFLTGEASSTGDSSYFAIENQSTSASDWTQYTFYIEVGLTSISLKQNLWLGYNTDYYPVENADDALSNGIALFDSVTLTKIDSKDFDSAVANETTSKINFLADSFDAISSTVESRNTLSSPSGWTGSVDTDQKSSNSKYGIVYADSAYYDNDGKYVSMLGKELSSDSITISQETLDEAKASGQYNDKSDDEIISILKDLELAKQKEQYWMPIEELFAHSGNRMLIINNLTDSAYYYSGSTMTMKAESYYQVSVWVRTYGINNGEEKGAYIELYLGSANEASNPLIFKAINTKNIDATNKWTQYTFYVKTLDDSVSSVKLKLGLGKYYNSEGASLTTGYAMFDDVEIKEIDITEEEFENIETNSTTLKRTVTQSSESGSTSNEGTTETPKNTFNLEYLWWMIPTIILAILIIAAIIVWAVRKIKRPKRVIYEEDTYVAESINEKHSKYDSNKE